RKLRPQSRQQFCGVIHGLPEFHRLDRLPTEISDRSTNSGDAVLEMRIAGGQQRKDVNIQRGRLMREKLGHDKRFRIARVSLQDIADAHALLMAHAKHPLTDGSSGIGEEASTSSRK